MQLLANLSLLTINLYSKRLPKLTTPSMKKLRIAITPLCSAGVSDIAALIRPILPTRVSQFFSGTRAANSASR